MQKPKPKLILEKKHRIEQLTKKELSQVDGAGGPCIPRVRDGSGTSD
jgi:hypothetical protein